MTMRVHPNPNPGLLLLLTFGLFSCTGDADPVDTDENLDTDDTDVLVLGSAGCGTKKGNVSKTLEVSGKTRTFVLSTPDDYDENQAYPLVFAWHGLGGWGSLARSYFGLKATAHHEAIVVYPDALPLDAFGGAAGWDLTESGYDLAFFDAMYTHLSDSLCVDQDRVFSTGHSFGGYMSNGLGCYRSDVLSGIAPVAGGLGFWGSCEEELAVWITHGSSDGTVPFSEGTSTRDHWIDHNDCADTTVSFSDDCVAYEGCARDVHWCEHGGDHDWPNFAGEAIWAFFAAQ
jgi:polyhydroxybutyrate depolymerase